MYRTYHAALKETVAVLKPGEYYATNKGEVLYTILGSCIATCIYDEEIAGMNHFMLPGVVNPRNILLTEVGRYGMFAMELLIGELIKLGGRRKNFKAKIFGGGHVLNFKKTEGNIPQANIDFARKFLELEGIPLAAEDVGGNKGRKVFFFTDSKKVFVKYLTANDALDPLKKVEQEYKKKLLESRSPLVDSKTRSRRA